MKTILLGFFFFLSVGLAAEEGAAKLNGYCPVAYVEMGKAIKGEAKFASVNNGSKWLFVNSDAKSMFDKNPDKYSKAIQFDAFCATGVALGKKIASDPMQFIKVGEKVYFFSSADAKAMFEKDQKSMTDKAIANWTKAKGNANNLN